MRTDVTVVVLVERARVGDKMAWDEIIERYTPLVWSICRRYHLDRHNTDDVGQSVWLRLVEHLAAIRDPAALPGWLATTARRECLRLLRTAGRRERSERDLDSDDIPADPDSTMVDAELLAAERDAVLRDAFAQLPARCQRLLSLMLRDPPPSYAEISGTLDMPIGGIGPSRSRCLDRLRRCPALAALTGAQEGVGEGGGHDR
ncbi:MAG TPA: sigma-70 family RNA polymerase sigma factor [Mycobacteriales bacterium]|nr:sigma-70 family RNA polymerase sigma factor [Mycobacteriales bacterium]